MENKEKIISNILFEDIIIKANRHYGYALLNVAEKYENLLSSFINTYFYFILRDTKEILKQQDSEKYSLIKNLILSHVDDDKKNLVIFICDLIEEVVDIKNFSDMLNVLKEDRRDSKEMLCELKEEIEILTKNFYEIEKKLSKNFNIE